MNSRSRKQQGAFMVLMAIIIAALLGFAALALDVGRVLVLRAEMQNAVDAAALAAAKELDKEPGARARAVANAKFALEHNSHFARVKELLGDATLLYTPGNDGDKATDDDAFTFFCVIGGAYDVDPDDSDVDFSDFCGSTTAYDTTGPDSKKYVATSDADASYVRVRLLPGNAPDNFGLNLIFLPVLEVFGGTEVLHELALAASALAGRSLFACDYPPIAICNPFEADGLSFDEAMDAGESVQLKQQGSNTWTNGNFGFLSLSGPGAGDVAHDLADETEIGCTPAIVTTKTGGNTNQTKSGLNTRFGIYDKGDEYYGDQYGSVVGGFANSWDTYAPAPSVARYPPDNGPNPDLSPSDARFGNGTWDCAGAWEDNHGVGTPIPGALSGICTASSSGWSRWDMYNWELDNLIKPVTTPAPAGLFIREDEHHDDTRSIRDRRRMFVAVLDCEAHGLSGGKTTAPLFGNDGFAEMFLIQPATVPGPNFEDGSIFAEYIGWGSESDGNFHVDVQLYE